MGDTVFGLVGKDFALVVADRSAARSILTFKHDEDKIKELDRRLILGAAGENCDRVGFTEYVKANLTLEKYRTGLELSTEASASWIRTQLAAFLRKRPYQVNCVLGGYDEDGASLYWLDYMGTKQKMNYAAQGYCGYFLYSVFDRAWKPDMTLDEAKDVVQKCIDELGTRFMLNQKKFLVKMVNAEGVSVVDMD